MKSLKHKCEECDSEFTIQYDEMICEDAPAFCPFCSEFLLEDNTEFKDE